MTPEDMDQAGHRIARWFAFALVFCLSEAAITALSVPLKAPILLTMLVGIPVSWGLATLFTRIDPIRRFIVAAFVFIAHGFAWVL